MADSGWDQSRFDFILNEYLEVTSRDVTTALNTKAYYIARRALWNTHKASSKEVRDLKKKTTDHRQRSPSTGGLLIGAMVSKRLGKGQGLYGSQMKSQIGAILAARLKSVAFLKSGWLPAIQGLEALAEAPGRGGPLDRSAKQHGHPHGYFQAATAGRMVATIVNSAIAKHDKKDALGKYGTRALQAAFDQEADSMVQYISDKLEGRTKTANAHL